MDDHQAACIATMKIATVRTIRPEKIPAAQRLRCAHIRSVSRIWRKSVARSAGDLSSSQVGGEVRGMSKMKIERNQKGGKTARKQMTNGPDIRETGGKEKTPTETILEQKLRKKKWFVIIARAEMLRVRGKVRFFVLGGKVCRRRVLVRRRDVVG